MGYFIHRRTYNIRKKLWNLIFTDIRKMLIVRENYSAIRVCLEYTEITKLLKNYGKSNNSKKRLERN